MVALLRWTQTEETQTVDRRIFERQELHARVEARRNDHTLTALRDRALSLVLRDMSVGGLGANSQTPIMPGERVSVFFPPQGAARGWDAIGRVVRCQPVGTGYDIGLEFDHRALAA